MRLEELGERIGLEELTGQEGLLAERIGLEERLRLEGLLAGLAGLEPPAATRGCPAFGKLLTAWQARRRRLCWQSGRKAADSGVRMAAPAAGNHRGSLNVSRRGSVSLPGGSAVGTLRDRHDWRRLGNGNPRRVAGCLVIVR